jgi:GntR family transcriptional repressor for pyruvate dehydrogenase complex
MHPTPVRRRTTAEDVAHHVLEHIRAGVYAPGDQLPTEPELARQLGVGRTSVREGIGQLRMVGVLEVRRGRGTYVIGPSENNPRRAFLEFTAANHEQILELFEVRMSLEAGAAALASQRATVEELDRLEAAAKAHNLAHASRDLAQLVRSDQAFHGALVACGHNAALLRVYDMLVPQLADYRRTSLALQGASERSSHDHLAIAAAVRAHAPQRARKAVTAHLAGLYQEVLQARNDDRPVPEL